MDWMGKLRALAYIQSADAHWSKYRETYSQRVNHGLEAKVDFAGADDLGDILETE